MFDHVLWHLGLLIWILWSVQAILSVLQVRKFSRMWDREPREDYAAYRPKAAVIVPFRGLEVDMAGGIRSLCTQRYPDYHLLLVVESTEDPAYEVIRREIVKYPDCKVELIIAGLTGPTEGQKVHNQLAAIEHLKQKQYGEEVWVFADSDAVPGEHWLGHQIGPLYQDWKTGVTTGYRWLVPENVRGLKAVWNHLASAMNASIACFYGRDEFNHAWGGAMAVRVDTAQRGDLVGMFRNTLSDDFQLSNLSKKLSLRIYFVYQCLVPAPISMSLAELMNFAYRQYTLSRIYAPTLFAAALSMQVLYFLGTVTSIIGLVHALWAYPGTCWWVVPAAAMLIVFVANKWRSVYRRKAVRAAFDQQVQRRLRVALWIDRWLTPVYMTAHMLLILRAAFGNTFDWRGTVYRLHGPQNIERL